MSLADELIAAQESQHLHRKSASDTAPEGFYTDDMGYWVEQDIRQDKMNFAKYIFYRCLRKHDDLYMFKGDLFQGHTQVYPTTQSIVALADTPETISSAQAIWVYNRIKEIAQELDLTKLRVGPHAVWDFTNSELIEEED